MKLDGVGCMKWPLHTRMKQGGWMGGGVNYIIAEIGKKKWICDV